MTRLLRPVAFSCAVHPNWCMTCRLDQGLPFLAKERVRPCLMAILDDFLKAEMQFSAAAIYLAQAVLVQV